MSSASANQLKVYHSSQDSYNKQLKAKSYALGRISGTRNRGGIFRDYSQTTLKTHVSDKVCPKDWQKAVGDIVR